MPLVEHKTLPQGGELALWKIGETPEQLLDVLRSQGIYADVPYFRNQGRLGEWLTARILLSELGVRQKIVYNELGKPTLLGDQAHVSISHSGEYVGVITHKTFPVGIDVERTGDRIHRVSARFVNERELQWVGSPPDTGKLYVIWGAKECAFKIYGLGEIDFRDHLEVEPVEMGESGVTRIHFRKNGIHSTYQVFFQYLDQLMVTYAIAS